MELLFLNRFVDYGVYVVPFQLFVLKKIKREKRECEEDPSNLFNMPCIALVNSRSTRGNELQSSL